MTPPEMAQPPAVAPFGFKIERVPDGWRWTAFDVLGQAASEGLAPSRVAAAAALIHALARV